MRQAQPRSQRSRRLQKGQRRLTTTTCSPSHSHHRVLYNTALIHPVLLLRQSTTATVTPTGPHQPWRPFPSHRPRRQTHLPSRRLEMTKFESSTADSSREYSRSPYQPPPSPSPPLHGVPRSPSLRTPMSPSPMAAVAPWASDNADLPPWRPM